MELENLRELFNSEAWESYREQIEETIYNLFVGMLDLEPSSPDSFVKFVILKSRINQLRDMTYILEHTTAVSPEKQDSVNKTYKGILQRLCKRLFKGA